MTKSADAAKLDAALRAVAKHYNVPLDSVRQHLEKMQQAVNRRRENGRTGGPKPKLTLDLDTKNAVASVWFQPLDDDGSPPSKASGLSTAINRLVETMLGPKIYKSRAELHVKQRRQLKKAVRNRIVRAMEKDKRQRLTDFEEPADEPEDGAWPAEFLRSLTEKSSG